MAAGALSGLQRRWGNCRQGANWASPHSLLGRFSYSTYRESDYDVIWDRYAYVKPLSIWFKRVRAGSALPSAALFLTSPLCTVPVNGHLI